MGFHPSSDIAHFSNSTRAFGVIAGDGELPFLLVEDVQLQAPERHIVFVPVTKASAELAPQNLPAGVSIFPCGVGQIRKITQTFHQYQVTEIAIIGKVHKSILLKPLHLDSIALQILARTRNRGDQAILSGVMAHFEAEGIGIVPQSRYLVDSIPKAGLLAKRKPTTAEWKDIKYGLEIARSIADLDIGQTVVLKDRIILSVEATEGTDQTIRRAGDLASKGMTVVKTAATHHDFRIDTPTIGSHTLEAMRAAEASVLAVEAERVLLIRPQELTQLANQYRISIVIVEPQKVVDS